jgi:hypothetical protein
MKDLISSGINTKTFSLIISGEPGSGKTTFGADSFEKKGSALVFDLENGSLGQNVDRISLYGKTFEEFMEALGFFYEGKLGKYPRILIDSLDWVERLILASVCKENGVKDALDIPYGRGFSYAIQYWGKLLQACDMIKSKGVSICMTAHTQIIKVNDPLHEEYSSHGLKLNKHAKALLTEYVDMIGYVIGNEVITSRKSDSFGKVEYTASGTGERKICFAPNPAYESKTRIAGIPDVLPLEWSAFEDAVKSVGATQPNTNQKKGE